MTWPKLATAGTAVIAGLFLAAACSSGGSEEAFCDRAQELQDLGRQFDPAAESDPGQAKQQFQETADKVDQAADAAPDEISDDVETLATAINQANDEVQTAPSLDQVDRQVFASMQSAENQIASQNVSTYIDENCGLETSGGSGP